MRRAPVIPRLFFQQAMVAIEETAQNNDDKPDWRDYSYQELEGFLMEEFKELSDELDALTLGEGTPEEVEARIRAEALDLVLVGLFVWRKAGGSRTVNRGREVPHGA